MSVGGWPRRIVAVAVCAAHHAGAEGRPERLVDAHLAGGVAQGQAAAQPVRAIGRGAVDDVVVVDADLAGAQDEVDGVAAAEVAALKAHVEHVVFVMFAIVLQYPGAMRAGDDLHGAVLDVAVLEGQPDRSRAVRRQRPEGGVLMPAGDDLVTGILAEELRAPEVEVRPEDGLQQVENARVVPSCQSSRSRSCHCFISCVDMPAGSSARRRRKIERSRRSSASLLKMVKG